MKILNIAEKPSVAKSISAVLSTNSRVTHGKHKYCPNIFFKWENDMIFTSVLGHLFSWDFKMKTGWTESDPYGLFEAEIEKRLSEDMKKVAENIKTLSRQCEMVVIWTDCDREGENIASQIREIVGNKKVRRARFSAISRSEVERAIRNLTEINDRESVAVEARIELDLRIGSAFTRFQTLAYSSACMFSKRLILSFGPCQIPTLNFVVQRHNQIIKFKPEKFYSLENKVIKMSIDKGYDNGYDKTIGKTINKSINKTIDKTIDRNTINDNKNRPFTCFKWKRGNIFSKNCILLFYSLLKNGRAIITNKAVQNREKFRPLPLRTVEFQKICSSYFKIPGHLLMEVAEKLYNNGYISYPRTETDSFIKGFNFNEIVNKLKNDEAVGSYASDFTFKYPRSGNSNDQAHSPIYPLKSGNG
ncbi:DNA topoisomerase III, partial [Pancytospora epiphaga]